MILSGLQLPSPNFASEVTTQLCPSSGRSTVKIRPGKHSCSFPALQFACLGYGQCSLKPDAKLQALPALCRQTQKARGRRSPQPLLSSWDVRRPSGSQARSGKSQQQVRGAAPGKRSRFPQLMPDPEGTAQSPTNGRGAGCTDGDRRSFSTRQPRYETDLQGVGRGTRDSLPCACHREGRQTQMPEQEGKEELVSPHREGSYWVTPQMRDGKSPSVPTLQHRVRETPLPP